MDMVSSLSTLLYDCDSDHQIPLAPEKSLNIQQEPYHIAAYIHAYDYRIIHP